MKNTRIVLSTLMLIAAGWAQAADVTLSNTWSFFNPEGLSQLNNQSSSNFDFVVREITNNVASAATYITTITADTTNIPSGGILVSSPGHGVPPSSTISAYINRTSVETYNTYSNFTPHVATALDADTFVIQDVPFVGNSTGGTIGTGTTPVGSGVARPKVYQIFNPVNLSAIGAAFSVQFDFSLLGESKTDNNDVFRIIIGDTVKNAELMALLDLGNTIRDDAIKIRLDNQAFATPPFSTSNPYEGPMGNAGQSWNVEADYPQPGGLANRLQTPGVTNRFFINLVRVSATELSVLFKLQVISGANAGHGTELYVLRYDETTGTLGDTGFTASPSDAWGNVGTPGALNQINFFGIHFFTDNPFGFSATNPNGTTNGGIRVTNLRVGTENYFKPYTKIIGLTRDTNTGDVGLSWNSFQDGTSSGSKYNVTAVDDLADFPTASPFATGVSASSSGIKTITESGTISPARFYRVNLSPRPTND